MGQLKVCAALAAAAVLLAAQARGRDVGKGRGGNEEVVDLKPVYWEVTLHPAVMKLDDKVRTIERYVAANLKNAPLGEDDPVIRQQRQQLKKAREELAKERARVRPGIEQRLRSSPRKPVYRDVSSHPAVKKLADKVQQLEQRIAATLKIATLGEDDQHVRHSRQQLKEAREELAKERKRVRTEIAE
jgi:hypothetical protein